MFTAVLGAAARSGAAAGLKGISSALTVGALPRHWCRSPWRYAGHRRAERRPPVQSDTCAAVSMHLVHTALSSPSDWRLNVTGTSLVSKGNAGTTVQVSSLTTPVMRRTAALDTSTATRRRP